MRRLLSLVLGTLLLPTLLQGAWLEMGTRYLEWDARELRVFELAPASPEAPSGPARVAGLAPLAVHALAAGEELMLVRFRHEDPRPALRKLGRVVADVGGRLVLALDAQGRARLGRMLGRHLRAGRLPVNRVLARTLVPVAVAPLLPHEALVEQVSADRWWQDVETLVAYGSRHSRSEGLKEAAEWCRQQFETMGMAAEVVHFSMWGDQVPNVIARLFPGAEGEARPIVLVGAHLDSIGRGAIAPGADDNASGSAGVLELARIFSGLPADPGVELRFALFGGEEQGLYGSKNMAKAMQTAGELERVVAMVNMDMIGFDQGGSLDVTLESYAFNQDGMDRMAALAGAYTDLVVTTTTDAWGSDHIPFLQRDVRAILPIEGEYDDNPHDHTSHDVMEHLNRDLARGILRMSTAFVLDLLPDDGDGGGATAARPARR